MAEELMKSFTLTLMGVILAPIVYSLAIAQNVSGTTAVVLAIVPVIFVVGVLFTSVKGMIK